MIVLPILLLLVAFACLVLEVFVVSFGTLSLVAIGLGTAGVLLAFRVSQVFGFTLLGVAVGGAPAVLWTAFRVLPKVPFARGMFLKPPQLGSEERIAAAVPRSELVGAEGTALCQLRPAGTAQFGDAVVPVVADGVLVERGKRIRVVKVSGNRIVVRPVEEANPDG